MSNVADYSESRKKSIGHNRTPTPYAGGPKAVLQQKPKLTDLPFPSLDEDRELSFEETERPAGHERKLTPFINLILPDSVGKKSKSSFSKKFPEPIMETDEDAESDLDLKHLEFDFQKSRLESLEFIEE
jgi:hypothetical protein